MCIRDRCRSENLNSMERVLKNADIASFLSHYPADHWFTILELLTLHSIRSLISFYFGYPNLEELEDFCKSRNTAFSDKLQELRHDFRKVDSKLQQLAEQCHTAHYSKINSTKKNSELENNFISKAAKNYFTPNNCVKSVEDEVLNGHAPGTIAFHKKAARVQEYPLQTIRFHNKSEHDKDHLNKDAKAKELHKEYYGGTLYTHKKLNSDIQGLKENSNGEDLKAYKTTRISTDRPRSKKSAMRKKAKELLSNIEDIRSHNNRVEAWVTDSGKNADCIQSHRLELHGTRSNANLNAERAEWEQSEGFNKFTTLIRNHKSKHRGKSDFTTTAFNPLRREEVHNCLYLPRVIRLNP
eukprot:TRINITY_DN14788_c0_g1_i2.p1 TRINITY_DN14788_c0_g1~~TRINITY_DN14788_c0_g1_i2.p1  ORF type:complete len:354 (+),score=82.98 TRINITY_DN14788_c0_g1_i2:72-1133(+)